MTVHYIENKLCLLSRIHFINFADLHWLLCSCMNYLNYRHALEVFVFLVHSPHQFQSIYTCMDKIYNKILSPKSFCKTKSLILSVIRMSIWNNVEERSCFQIYSICNRELFAFNLIKLNYGTTYEQCFHTWKITKNCFSCQFASSDSMWIGKTPEQEKKKR